MGVGVGGCMWVGGWVYVCECVCVCVCVYVCVYAYVCMCTYIFFFCSKRITSEPRHCSSSDIHII